MAGPKSFITNRIHGDDFTLEKALIFLAISFSICWILETPWIRGDPLLELGSDISFTFMYILGYRSSLYIAWYIVGGRSEFKKFIIIHLYFSSVIKLIITFTFLCMTGLLKIMDPILFKDFVDSIYSGNSIAIFLMKNEEFLFNNIAFQLFILGMHLGLGLILAWIFVGWGTYRELNQLSKFKSTLASFLFLVFCLPVMMITSLIAFSLIK